jgi:L-fuconolactonase
VIVDGHHHLWNLGRSPQAWLTGSFAPIARTFEPEELRPLLDECSIDSTVLVQGDCTDSDTDQLFEHAARHDWIGAVTAWVPLASPERARARLDELAGRPKLRGVRHLIHNETDDHWILQPRVLESLALLEQRGLLLELPVVYPRHLDDVRILADSFPRLTIVIDHLGKPPIGTPEMAQWEIGLQAAAARENVTAKVSGLNTCVSARDWTADDLRPAVMIAIDCFGPNRLLFGSDWPVSLLNGSYSKVVGETRRALEGLPRADADAILGGTACSLYRLDTGPSATTGRTGEG